LFKELKQKIRTLTDYHDRPGRRSRRILEKTEKIVSQSTAKAYMEVDVRRRSHTSLIH